TRLWNWTYLAGCLAILPCLLESSPRIVARDYRLAWLLLKLRRWIKCPLVFEVHGLPSAELLDRGRVGANVRREARRRRNLEQEVFRKAWRILTITDCLRQRLIGEYGVPPDRVFTVPDGSRASIDTPQRTAEQSKSCQRANGS